MNNKFSQSDVTEALKHLSEMRFKCDSCGYYKKSARLFSPGENQKSKIICIGCANALNLDKEIVLEES